MFDLLKERMATYERSVRAVAMELEALHKDGVGAAHLAAESGLSEVTVRKLIAQHKRERHA